MVAETKMTPARWAVLEQLTTGNRARRYGRGWCFMGWPYSLIPQRTWEPLEAAGLVDDQGRITERGRAMSEEWSRGR